MHYDYTTIEVFSNLKKLGVLEHVENYCENEKSTALVLIVKKTRFFAECVTVNRLSRANYHINYGSQHIRVRTARQCAKEVKNIILKIIFLGETK